jgi:hypothetical protein
VPSNNKFSAKELNKFFVDSIPNIDSTGSLLEIDHSSHPKLKFKFHAVDEIAILTAIRSIKSNAVGDDGIPLKFIKIMIPVILPFICHIINSCLVNSEFPSQWKISKVIPIAKVAHPKTINDMRPISILSVLSKVLEVIMKNQINEYLDNHKLFISFQSGFCSKHSTTTAMLNIIDDISSYLDENQAVFLVLLDFSKAFDMLSHDILLQKLEGLFNFSKQAIKMIHNYLTNRSQYVSYCNEISAPVDTHCGVPQGSVLGHYYFQYLLMILLRSSLIANITYMQMTFKFILIVMWN